MPLRMAKIVSIILVFCLALVTVACGANDSGRDIEPIETLEAQAVPDFTVEPTSTPEPPTPPATGLPTELVEPVSPVSPELPPKDRFMMPQINSDVQLISGGEQALAAATTDLAERTGLSPNQIRLVSMEARDWNDTSLGCPQEGFMYAQVITPGYLIILEAQGQQYEYHTNQTDNVVLCQQ